MTIWLMPYGHNGCFLVTVNVSLSYSQHKPYHYGHHGFYLVEKIVSNILKKALGRTFDRELMSLIDFYIFGLTGGMPSKPFSYHASEMFLPFQIFYLFNQLQESQSLHYPTTRSK